MKNLIVANWKLNPSTQKEAKALFQAVKKKAKVKNVEVVICPPFAWLAEGRRQAAEGGFILGAQNCFFEEKGAFTGEISVLMLKDLKIDYVILGHSERRKYFNETDEIVNKKIKKVLSANLKPILCIGETDEERQAGKKSEVLEKQITGGLKGVLRENAKTVVIAYEPVWAIGTGNNCSVDETMSSVLFIRKIISKIYNREIADNMRILYGGSVKSENSGSYIKDAGANGLLVGGASLNAEEFIKIVKSAE
ncbi:MAG: triose-phosphate isomerase [Patescibacteria group bacterium]